MGNKLFKLIAVALFLIMVAATAIKTEYFWPFLVGVCMEFVIIVLATSNYEKQETNVLAGSVISAIVAVALNVFDYFQNNQSISLVPLTIWIAGCFALFIVGKAWFFES